MLLKSDIEHSRTVGDFLIMNSAWLTFAFSFYVSDMVQ